MGLELICAGRWQVYFYKEGENCPVDEYINANFNDKLQAHLFACFGILAERGRTGLNTEIFHSAADSHDIEHNGYLYKMYGLHKGKNRLYAILQEDSKIIIFTHGALKKGQKTAREDIGRFKEITCCLIDEGVVL